MWVHCRGGNIGRRHNIDFCLGAFPTLFLRCSCSLSLLLTSLVRLGGSSQVGEAAASRHAVESNHQVSQRTLDQTGMGKQIAGVVQDAVLSQGTGRHGGCLEGMRGLCGDVWHQALTSVRTLTKQPAKVGFPGAHLFRKVALPNFLLGASFSASVDFLTLTQTLPPLLPGYTST